MKKLILLVSLAVLAACSPKETVDEVFVQSTDIQLRIDGVTLYTPNGRPNWTRPSRPTWNGHPAARTKPKRSCR